MDKQNYILASYKIDGKSGTKKLTEPQISKAIKAKNLAWVHLDAESPDTQDWLHKEISYLDPFIIEALLAEETRPRITEIGDGALIILRGVNLNKDSSPEDMVSIRMWVDSHRIISLQKRQLKAIIEIEESIKKGNGPRNSGEFLCDLISKLFERIEVKLQALEEYADDIEEQILDNPDTSCRKHIVTVRKQAIMYKRYMSPQKDVILSLRNSEIKWLDNNNKRHIQENYDRITRYVEDLDAIRERSQIVKDELSNILSDKLNKNMYILSVIAAIFLPLGFLTGLLGINVGGIPGVDNPHAFYIFCGITTIIVTLQIILFKRLKWF